MITTLHQAPYRFPRNRHRLRVLVCSHDRSCILSFGIDLLHSAISSLSTLLHPITVYTCSLIVDDWSIDGSCSPVEVYIFNVEGVQMAGNVTKKSETDVYEYIHAAACDHEDTDRWEKDGDEDNEKGWECGIVWRHVGYPFSVDEVGTLGKWCWSVAERLQVLTQ